MFSGTKRNLGFLAWSALTVATLGVAAGASAVVPRLVNSEEAPSVSATAQVQTAAVAADVGATPAPEAEVAVPEVVVPEPAAVVVRPSARVAAPTVVEPDPVVEEAPAVAPVLAPVAAVSALAARTVPSAAQIQAVISTIKSQVPLLGLVSITDAQVNDIGNQVCTAFDQGQTFAQVKAQGLAQVPAYVTIPAATADYAVRQAVALYCPAYTSKLV
jgi:hypothetical protein